jgi:hypothetical protein
MRNRFVVTASILLLLAYENVVGSHVRSKLFAEVGVTRTPAVPSA